MPSVFQDMEDSTAEIASAIVTANDAPAMRVEGASTAINRISFAKAISGGVDPLWGSVITLGTGMTVNLANGNLVLTTGTGARQETILRSLTATEGDIRFRMKSMLSQRIVNQNFIAELVDIVGDGLAYTINSATSISVTMPSGQFSAENVGQSITLCNFSGTGTFLSGRYVIASVAGDVVNFTVAGFAVGSGTLSAVGLNYYRLMYDSATATSAKYDTGRSGYGAGDTTLAVATSASPGHIIVITGKDMVSTVSDSLPTSGTAVQLTQRGNRQENVPSDRALYLQFRVLSLATAPASNTTWTIGFVSVAPLKTLDITIQDVRPMSMSTGMPVEVVRTVGVGTTAVTLASTTVTASTPVAGTAIAVTTAASTNATLVKATTTGLFEIAVNNNSGATVYLKFFNKATAPVPGTDNPVFYLACPVGDTFREFGAIGKRFPGGLGIAVTANAANSDTTAVAAGILISGTYV